MRISTHDKLHIIFLFSCLEDINECESNPCGAHGICTDLVNGFNCTCLDGYTGDVCETGESLHHVMV